MPGRPNQVRGKESDIAGAAANVENRHSRPDSGFDEKAPGNRIDELSLAPKALQLAIRMAENVAARFLIGIFHEDVPVESLVFGPCCHPPRGSARPSGRDVLPVRL